MKGFFINSGPSIFLLIMPAGWVVASYLISKMGWHNMAREYNTGRQYSFSQGTYISAKINMIEYKSCVRLVHDMDGMYLRPMPLFRLFHPPLFIPWREIEVLGETSSFFQRSPVLSVGSSPATSIQLDWETFMRMKQHFYPGRETR